METLKSIITVMHPHQWMAIVDLKDAYFHIRVVPANHQYLRFCWLGESYQFKALPFGLSLAPQVFTKTLAPLVAWFRLTSGELYPYLDDILILGESPCEVEHSVQTTLQVNLKKSRPDPYTGSGVHRGQVPDRPGQIVPAGGTDRRASSPCHILLQSKAAQTSSPLFEPAGPHGSHIAVSGVRPPLHVPIQWYLKRCWNHITYGLHFMVLVTKDLNQALQ